MPLCGLSLKEFKHLTTIALQTFMSKDWLLLERFLLTLFVDLVVWFGFVEESVNTVAWLLGCLRTLALHVKQVLNTKALSSAVEL
eukprot:6465833-Amphidinium_carterae.1